MAKIQKLIALSFAKMMDTIVVKNYLCKNIYAFAFEEYM